MIIPMKCIVYLSLSLRTHCNAKQKIDIINKEYDIPVESNIEEGVSIMCNLSQGIEEKAL